MSSKINIDNSWEIIEHFTDPRNEDLLHALVNGANALSIEFREPLNEKETSAIFEGIHLDFIELYFQGHEQTVEIAEKLTNKFQSHEIYSFANQAFEQELETFLQQSKLFLANSDLSKTPRISFQVDGMFLDNISKIRSRERWKKSGFQSSDCSKLAPSFSSGIKNGISSRPIERQLFYRRKIK